MKLFLALIFSLTAFGSFAQDNYIDNEGVVKTRKIEFVTVINSASAALTKGMVVCYDLTDDDGINVDYCSVAGAKAAGVIISDSCAIGARCKMQTKGFIAFGNFDYVATATVAGGMIYAGTAGQFDMPATVTTAMSPVGMIFDALAADSTTAEIFIDL